MYKEVLKGMNKNNSVAYRIKKWYHINGYKTNRIILFPIWIATIIKDKIHRRNYNRTEWSEKRADEILSYYVPRTAEWDVETKEFYFADNGLGWGKHNLRKIKPKDRQFWKKYARAWGGEMRKYLIEKFELDGFEKTVGDTYDSWTEITFTLKEEN